MCDTEFTIEQGKLWMLQTRVGKRTGAAALRMAVEMTKGTKNGKAGRWSITREEAVSRVTAEHLDSVLHPQFAREGQGRSPRVSARRPARPSARAYFTADEAAAASKQGEDVILVRSETSPEDVHGMMASKGILTARGGLVSHAAVVARGWGTPAVVGADAVKIDGQAVHRSATRSSSRATGISLDGTTGEVMVGKLELAGSKPPPEFDTILDVGRRDPQGQARRARQRRHRRGRRQRPARSGAEGIGLCRTEHMFLAPTACRSCAR